MMKADPYGNAGLVCERQKTICAVAQAPTTKDSMALIR